MLVCARYYPLLFSNFHKIKMEFGQLNNVTILIISNCNLNQNITMVGSVST